MILIELKIMVGNLIRLSKLLIVVSLLHSCNSSKEEQDNYPLELVDFVESYLDTVNCGLRGAYTYKVNSHEDVLPKHEFLRVRALQDDYPKCNIVFSFYFKANRVHVARKTDDYDQEIIYDLSNNNAVDTTYLKSDKYIIKK